MKKVLILFLTLILLLPCFSGIATAQNVVVNDVYVDTGWDFSDDTGTATDELGENVMARKYTKPLHATWGYPENKTEADFDQISFSYTFSESYNLTNMIYLTMEIYADDIENLLNHRWILSLSSDGGSTFTKSNGQDLEPVITDIGGGWYRVDIKFRNMIWVGYSANFNETACNYFRMYYDGTETQTSSGVVGPFTFEGENYTFGIRSIGFSDTSANDVEFGKYIELGAWNETETWHGDPAKNTTLVSGRTVYSKTYAKPLLAGWAKEGENGATVTFDSATHTKANLIIADNFTAVDVTDCAYVIMDIYLSDTGLLDKKLTVSVGSNSSNRIYNEFLVLRDYSENIGGNWYRVAIPFSALTKTGGTFDKTACAYVQMFYNDNTVYEGGNGLVFAFASLGFSSRNTDATMLGMSIRCVNNVGVRFGASFSKTGMKLTGIGEADGNGVIMATAPNFGIILVSEAKYAANPTMTFAEAVEAGIQVPAEKIKDNGDYYEVYAVLSGIAEANYKDNIVAIPYVNDQFAGAPVIRSLYGVAQCVVADSEAASGQKAFCQNLIDTADGKSE